jgi:uncharacterized protein
VAAALFAVPPVPHHYVTDNAGALDASTHGAIEAELKAYEQQTHHQVVVWIDQTTGDVPLETWTAETAHSWRIGRRGYDDGAVLFLFMRDHRVRIEVGYGLESSLTDADSKRIIDETIVPSMRAGNPNAAVANGVGAMLKTITPDFATSVSEPTPQSSENEGSSSPVPFFLFFFLVWLVPIAFIVWRLRGRGGSGGGSGGSWIGSSSSDSSSSDDGDFDSGGGDFGGGGASGSW